MNAIQSARGGRSKRTDGASTTTVEEHAVDLYRLTKAIGGAPVTIFASRGGAADALALVATFAIGRRTSDEDGPARRTDI